MSNASAPAPPGYDRLELQNDGVRVPRTENNSFEPVRIDLVTENETDELIIRRFISPASYKQSSDEDFTFPSPSVNESEVLRSLHANKETFPSSLSTVKDEIKQEFN